MITIPDLDLARAVAVARQSVAAAAAAALPHFRRGVRVEMKSDRTPVTIADRESEAAIIRLIRQSFPDHSILGEETGASGPSAESRWVIDPIDGTRGFTRGGNCWGPLVGLEHRGEIVAGAMAMPALGETYWAARGMGAWWQREPEAPMRLRVSGIASWEEATLSLGEMRFLFAKETSEPMLQLITTCAQPRCYGDLSGCALLLTGRAEVWIEAGVNIWDLAPLKILVEEAGGKFTDFRGTPTFYFQCTVQCPHLSCLSCVVSALQVLYLCLFSPYCPPVCMPAAGCQPIRPPGQFFQPLTLLQCHQHRQGS